MNTADIKVLKNDEMIKLFKELRKGNLACKEKLINGNLKLVLSVLKGFNKKGINQDDLFQVGVIGLIKAIDNFDLSYNLKLSTYAVPLIVGEIKKYLRDNTQMRVARSIKDDAYKILRFKEEYINKYGKEPLNSEISKELNISEIDISFALNALKERMSIFAPIYSDGGDTIYLEDQIADTKEKSFDKDMMIS